MHTTLIVTCIALQLVDFATTHYALRQPGTKEGNGVMAWLMARIGVLPALIVTKLGFAVVLWVYGPLAPMWALWIVLVVYLVVAVNNVRVIRSVRAKRAAAGVVNG